jgi:hypothetical protein
VRCRTGCGCCRHMSLICSSGTGPPRCRTRRCTSGSGSTPATLAWCSATARSQRCGASIGGQRQLPAPAGVLPGHGPGLHGVDGGGRGDRGASARQRHRLDLLGRRPAVLRRRAGHGVRRVRLRHPPGFAAWGGSGGLYRSLVLEPLARPDPGVHPVAVPDRPAAVGPLAPGRGGGGGRDGGDDGAGCPAADHQAAERGLHRPQPHRACRRPRPGGRRAGRGAVRAVVRLHGRRGRLGRGCGSAAPGGWSASSSSGSATRRR